MEKNKNQAIEGKSKEQEDNKGGKETSEDSKSDERKIEQGKPPEES